jgi:CRP-like cAMP-binding protein
MPNLLKVLAMSTLHQTINALAAEFAHSLLKAFRSASFEEIISETAPGHSAHGKGRRGRPAESQAGAAPKRGGRRLRRRSLKDITAMVGRIVSLLHSHKKGLRAEDIRQKLGIDRRELPRPLAEALKKKLVSKRGKKRATTYFAGKK